MIATCRPSSDTDPDIFLPFILPVIILSIQTSYFIDSSLGVLTRMLHFRQSTRKTLSLSFSPHITVPLCSLLPAVASSHADPLTRHCVLSLLIVASEPQLRFRPTNDSKNFQMRVASVGQVKEALYRSLRVRTISSWLPCFCAVLGPFSDLILPISSSLQIWISRNSWALETGGIFVSIMSCEGKEQFGALPCFTLFRNSLLHTEFLIRLTQAGIRDTSVRKAVDTNLLISFAWPSCLYLACPSYHNITPIVSLEISFERVDTATS